MAIGHAKKLTPNASTRKELGVIASRFLAEMAARNGGVAFEWMAYRLARQALVGSR